MGLGPAHEVEIPPPYRAYHSHGECPVEPEGVAYRNGPVPYLYRIRVSQIHRLKLLFGIYFKQPDIRTLVVADD